MRKGLYIFVNLLMAILLFFMGAAAAGAITLLLYVAGIYLIILGCSAFVKPYIYDEDGYVTDIMGFGSQCLACAIFAIPGILLIKFADSVVEANLIVELFAGIFFIIFGLVRLRKSTNEAYDYYVEGFANVCTYLYPLLMVGGGVCYILSGYVDPSFAGIGSIALIASSVLWIVRTFMVVSQN
jgi:hypothetical protein